MSKGNKDFRLIDCCIFGKSKEIRDKVVEEIKKEAIIANMRSKAVEGKSS